MDASKGRKNSGGQDHILGKRCWAVMYFTLPQGIIDFYLFITNVGIEDLCDRTPHFPQLVCFSSLHVWCFGLLLK